MRRGLGIRRIQRDRSQGERFTETLSSAGDNPTQENGSDAVKELTAEMKDEKSPAPKRMSAALKSWLDNVIIPNLVRQYLRERPESQLANDTSTDLNST